MEKICCQLIISFFSGVLWNSLLSKQHPGCHWKGQRRDSKFTLFYPRAENTLQVCPVPFLPLRGLPPAQSSGQRAEARLHFGHPLPFPGAGPRHIPVDWPWGAANRWLCPCAWQSERGGGGAERGRRAGSREALATLAVYVPRPPQGSHFHIIYNYLFALIASSLRRLSWAQEEEKLINWTFSPLSSHP